MTAEQFCLRWNNHQSTLVSVFDGLFESGTLVDCTLAADGQFLKAHKVVLSACSPYLEALLSQHYNQHPIVILKDVKFEELKAMLEYMYRGEVNVTQEQLGRFLKAAETLKIKGLTNHDVSPSGGGGQITSACLPTTATTAVPVTTTTPVTNLGGAGDAREVPMRTRQDSRKSALPAQQPVQPRSPILGNQTSLVETLKNAPASLVIDIPPISPVNSKEGSVSPTPRKRRKRKQSQNDEYVSNIKENNKQKINSDIHPSNFSERSNESLDVDPLTILETGLVKPEVKMESGGDNDDDNSEGDLTMDEDYDGSSKAGPSNGSSIAADSAAWQGAVSDDGENAESSKGGNDTDLEDTTLNSSLEFTPFEIPPFDIKVEIDDIENNSIDNRDGGKFDPTILLSSKVRFVKRNSDGTEHEVDYEHLNNCRVLKIDCTDNVENYIPSSEILVDDDRRNTIVEEICEEESSNYSVNNNDDDDDIQVVTTNDNNNDVIVLSDSVVKSYKKFKKPNRSTSKFKNVARKRTKSKSSSTINKISAKISSQKNYSTRSKNYLNFFGDDMYIRNAKVVIPKLITKDDKVIRKSSENIDGNKGRIDSEASMSNECNKIIDYEMLPVIMDDGTVQLARVLKD